MTPTRARFTLLRFTLALAVVTYLDRVAISSAAPAIRGELGLSLIQMGWVFSVFTFAYAAFEIPSGWLGDVTGPRKVLTRIVLWWSAFTMLTGAAWNFVSLLVVRFMFGVGEAGAFPNISQELLELVPDRRTRQCARRDLHGHAARRRAGAAADRAVDGGDRLAGRVRRVRRHRRRLVRVLAAMVQGRSGHAPVGQRGGARNHPARAAAARQPCRRSGGGSSCRATSSCSA